MLREGPGIFAGDEYDRKKVEKELDKFPKDISPEDAYNRLIYLLAEDYEALVDEMKNLDMTYTLRSRITKWSQRRHWQKLKVNK